MLHLAISAGVPDAGVLTLEGLRCGAQARASRQNRTELNKRNRDERATTHTATTVSNGETVKRQGSDIAPVTLITRYSVQAGCALVARLLATARVFEIAVKAGYVSC